MCDPLQSAQAVFNTGIGLAQQVMGNNTKEDLANYQTQIALNNEAIAQQQEQNTVNTGVSNVAQQNLKTAQTVGTDRARMAAAGLDMGSATPTDILSDASNLGLVEANNIRDATVNQVNQEAGQVMNDASQATMDQYQAKNLQNQNNLGLAETGLGIGDSLFNWAANPADSGDAPEGLGDGLAAILMM